MNITELIEILEDVKAEHGDIDVAIDTDMDTYPLHKLDIEVARIAKDAEFLKIIV